MLVKSKLFKIAVGMTVVLFLVKGILEKFLPPIIVGLLFTLVGAVGLIIALLIVMHRIRIRVGKKFFLQIIWVHSLIPMVPLLLTREILFPFSSSPNVFLSIIVWSQVIIFLSEIFISIAVTRLEIAYPYMIVPQNKKEEKLLEKFVLIASEKIEADEVNEITECFNSLLTAIKSNTLAEFAKTKIINETGPIRYGIVNAILKIGEARSKLRMMELENETINSKGVEYTEEIGKRRIALQNWDNEFFDEWGLKTG
jgi:hypothetical protein